MPHTLSARSLLFGLAAVFTIATARGQAAIEFDTLTVMQYNLTNYGNVAFGCTNTNNGLAIKDSAIRRIVRYVQPDILGVNEVNQNEILSDRILATCLNQFGRTSWRRAAYTNNRNSDIVNMLYYDGAKLGIKGTYVIPTVVRDVNHYRLYRLPVPTGDTTFINIIVAHLKAGNTSPDAVERGNQAVTIRTYMNQPQWAGEEFVMMGDLNVYSSTEAGYANLVDSANGGRLHDPLNRPGSWTGNFAFRDIHTQSPRITSDGCHSGGGLDDRFDNFLATRGLLNGTTRVQFLRSSYIVIGNDGQRFNGEVNDPVNRQVPQVIADALFANSDHLPIRHKLVVQRPTAVLRQASQSNHLKINVQPGAITVTALDAMTPSIGLSLYSTDGRLLVHDDLTEGKPASLATQNMPEGVYLLQATGTRFSQTTLVRIAR